MRETWRRWTCVTIGLSAAVSQQARASDFSVTIVPAKASTAPGIGAASRSATRTPPGGRNAVTVLPLPASRVTDRSARMTYAF